MIEGSGAKPRTTGLRTRVTTTFLRRAEQAADEVSPPTACSAMSSRLLLLLGLQIGVGLLLHLRPQLAEARGISGLLELVELAVDVDHAVVERVGVLRDDVVHLRSRLLHRGYVRDERCVGRLREVSVVLCPRE